MYFKTAALNKLRHGGVIYKVSPYQLLMNDCNYYLLAFDDKSQEIRTYRIDRMDKVEAIDEPRDGTESFKEIDMETYTRRVFSMFDGVQRRVSIRFTNSKLDTIVSSIPGSAVSASRQLSLARRM